MIQKDKEAMTTDPIFAAIAAHRSVWVAEMAAMERVDEPLAREQGRTVTPADIETNERASSAEKEAMAALKQTHPVTMAGLKASLAYFIDWDGDQMCEDASIGLRALLRSPLLEEAPRKNVALDVLFDLEEDVRNLHGMSQICQVLVEKGAHPEIVTKAVDFAASMAFDLEQKYDEAFKEAARETEEQIEA